MNSEEHKDLSPFRFVPKIESLDGPYPICEEILLRGKGANVVKESKAHEEMFHINNLYAGYKDKVSKLYAKGYKLNDSVVKYMSAAFGIKPSTSDILAYLSDFTRNRNILGRIWTCNPLARIENIYLGFPYSDFLLYIGIALSEREV